MNEITIPYNRMWDMLHGMKEIFRIHANIIDALCRFVHPFELICREKLWCCGTPKMFCVKLSLNWNIICGIVDVTSFGTTITTAISIRYRFTALLWHSHKTHRECSENENRSGKPILVNNRDKKTFLVF